MNVEDSTWMISCHLNWPNCLNARDLGGMPASDGSTIRTRALVRTDGHEHLTAIGVKAVHSYGVGRIIDLRRESECANWPSPFADSPIYLNLPVQGPADPNDHSAHDLGGIYCTMLDLRPSLFAAAVSAIADAPPGAVVVHCVGGQDRTGIVVALALTVAGVAPETIAADYALTEERLRERSLAMLAEIDDPARREHLRTLHHTTPGTMLGTLAYLRDRYGSVEGYLKAGGCDARRQARLRNRLRASG